MNEHERRYWKFRADLTDEQWGVLEQIVKQFEKVNVMVRATDKSPDEFDDDGGKVWHVWVEGYEATGERGYAQLVGTKWAKDFNRACELIHIESVFRGRGTSGWGDFTPAKDGRPPSFWGCRLYDNELDARRSFG